MTANREREDGVSFDARPLPRELTDALRRDHSLWLAIQRSPVVGTIALRRSMPGSRATMRLIGLELRADGGLVDFQAPGATPMASGTVEVTDDRGSSYRSGLAWIEYRGARARGQLWISPAPPTTARQLYLTFRGLFETDAGPSEAIEELVIDLRS